jgi:hypothetical protein
MSRAPLVQTFVVIILLLIGSAAGHAQSLGTFRWQLQPYCNVVTLSITGAGGVYTLDGFDDQCGAATRAPLTGTAAPNPDGTIELGFGIVTSPDAVPVHVAVAINPTTLGGTWTDSAGHTGDFAFTPGSGTGGEPRPHAGAIGAIAVNPEQVQLRVSGSCPDGEYVGRINQDGSVMCGATSTTGISSILIPATGGLVASTTSGTATLRLAKTGTGAFDFSNDSGLLSDTPRERLGSALSVSGPGKRFFWYPAKAAFRAGRVHGTQWDDANVGVDSAAFGTNTVASGVGSFAAGEDSAARGFAAIALGWATEAAGDYGIALGSNARAGTGSFVFGDRSTTRLIPSAAPNEFSVRASGGVYLFTSPALFSGVQLPPGASAWLSVSDVNMKENFRDLDGAGVLAKISAMPIREWNYKSQDAAIRHVGPTAQDFHAAFGLGEDPLRISTIDADGIALAAVKALALENQELRARIDALEQLIRRQ